MYKFVHLKNRVIAISTYAGKTVKGEADCHPDDEFDIEFGEKLAEARCRVKVAKKRAARAKKKYIEAEKMMKDAVRYLTKMSNYSSDAEMELHEAKAEVVKLTEQAK